MRNTYKAFLLLLVLWAAPAGAADSQHEALLQFAANNAGFDAKVEETGRALFRQQIEGCKTIDRAVRQLPRPYGSLTYPPEVPGFPAPIHGLWSEHVKILGCGKLWQVNMLAIGRKEREGPMLMALLPGDTLSDPGSQRNAERMGATAIRKADASCADTPKANYTRLLGYRQPDGSVAKKDAGEGWFEEWTYRFCQKIVPVQMAFTPDGSGGFEIKARLAQTTPPATPVAKPSNPAQPVVPAPQAPANPAGATISGERSVPPAE